MFFVYRIGWRLSDVEFGLFLNALLTFRMPLSSTVCVFQVLSPEHGASILIN